MVRPSEFGVPHGSRAISVGPGRKKEVAPCGEHSKPNREGGGISASTTSVRPHRGAPNRIRNHEKRLQSARVGLFDRTPGVGAVAPRNQGSRRSSMPWLFYVTPPGSRDVGKDKGCAHGYALLGPPGLKCLRL